METIKEGIEISRQEKGRITVNNTEFYFSAYWNNYRWKLQVWGDRGVTSVISLDVPSESEKGVILSAETSERLLHAMVDWTNGYQLCSNCHTRMKKESVAGRYFAGQYCAVCWETKYKSIAASEDYN